MKRILCLLFFSLNRNNERLFINLVICPNCDRRNKPEYGIPLYFTHFCKTLDSLPICHYVTLTGPKSCGNGGESSKVTTRQMLI